MNRRIEILVVGKDRIDNDTAAKLLENESYQVSHADSGDEALKILNERRVDVVLSYAELPGRGGYELCRQIKDGPGTKDMPVILLSSICEPADIIKSLQCGADNFIVSPFNPDYLLSWIKVRLEAREPGKPGGLQPGLFGSCLEARVQERTEALRREAEAVGGIAHDLNNFLTSINGYADFLLAGPAPEDKIRHDVAEIKKYGMSAVALTVRLLALSRSCAAKAQRGPETILLVEDDDAVRSSAQRVLSESGYTVLEASDPGEAARICAEKAGAINLVLTDTVMPVMDGPKMYSLIAKRYPGIKVLYMSGYTEAALADACLSHSGRPFLQKPFSADALAKKVREVLDAGETAGEEDGGGEKKP